MTVVGILAPWSISFVWDYGLSSNAWKHAQSDASQLDYFLNETDRWIVLPYELSGLSSEENREHKPELRELSTFSRALAVRSV